MASARTPPPVARSPPETRSAAQAVLQAAAEAFAHGGYAATSMEEIAAAAGITKLIVYRHFESKETLYRAVLEQVFDRQVELFLANIAQGLAGRGHDARAARRRPRMARRVPAAVAARGPRTAVRRVRTHLRDVAVERGARRRHAARRAAARGVGRADAVRPPRRRGPRLARPRRRRARRRVRRAGNGRAAGDRRRLGDLPVGARHARARGWTRSRRRGRRRGRAGRRGRRPRRAARRSSPRAAT